MASSSSPEFRDVAAIALDMAHILLPDWIGGHRKGHEWCGETKANGGPGDSWVVNLNTGNWMHGAGDEKGVDMISLFACRNSIKQGIARKEVAKLVGADREVSIPRARSVVERPEEPQEPIPLSAPDATDHPTKGKLTACYRYGTAFWVLRFEKDGAKTFVQQTWRNGRWQAKAHPDPRPLYRLTQAMENPDSPLLIVEGEKAAEALQGVMSAYIVMTWAGGSNAVKKSDWTPLKGRDVLIWPDADEPGAKAAAQVAAEAIKAGAAKVRVINVDDHTDGWDAADAIEEGWGSKQIVEWAKPRIKQVHPKTNGAAGAPHAADESPKPTESTAVVATVVSAGELAESSIISWDSLKLELSQGGQPFATISNASLILQRHPRFAGHVWFDEFTGKVYTDDRGVPRQWTDYDDLNITVFIQQSLRLNKFKMDLVSSGVVHAARAQARNSLVDWLESLEWDRVPRLETWLKDCLGVEHNEYTMAVAVNWPISLVARAFKPGCKVDTMPVLEGPQGLSKSTFLEVLGHPWYGSIPTAFGDKDFLQAIQGRWVVEIPDMTGFSRREHEMVLATITIRSDIYRASYGRYTEEHPRVTVFAATSEKDDYLKDARGRRRYWPLRCEDIDIDALRGQRDQVFAEAVVRYRDGAHWWEMPSSANDEQIARVEPDLWTARVLDYCNELWEVDKMTCRPGASITSTRILSGALDILLAKQDDGCKARISRIMRENKWIQKRDAHGRYWRKGDR